MATSALTGLLLQPIESQIGSEDEMDFCAQAELGSCLAEGIAGGSKDEVGVCQVRVWYANNY